MKKNNNISSSNNNATVNSLLGTTFEAIMQEHSQFLNGWRTFSGVVCGKTHSIDGKEVFLYLAHRTEITIDEETNSVSSETHRYFVSAVSGKTEFQKEIDLSSATESQLVDMLEEALASFEEEAPEKKEIENYIINNPMGRGFDLKDNLIEACAEEIMEAWWRGDCWEGTFDITDTLGGVYSARIVYCTDATLVATILGPDDAEIGYREFDIECEGAAFAFEDMCKWIDIQLDEIEHYNR